MACGLRRVQFEKGARIYHANCSNGPSFLVCSVTGKSVHSTHMKEALEKTATADAKLTAETKLQIQEAVEARLEKLPASTYRLLETMVEERVAAVEKFYLRIGIVVIFAIGVSATAFYRVTADNASTKASEAIIKSALGEKLKEVEQAHTQIQNTKNQVASVGAEALDSAVKITAKLQELEKQDNILRLSHNGNLLLNLQDGELRLRRKNPDREIMMYVDKDGHFQITDGTNTFDALHARYLKAE